MMTSKPKLMTNRWSGAQLHEFHRPRGSKLPDGAWLGALGPKIGAPEKLHHLNRDRCTKSRLHKSRRHKSLGKSFLVTNCRWAAVKLTHCSWLWSEGSSPWQSACDDLKPEEPLRELEIVFEPPLYLRLDLNSDSNDMLSSSFFTKDKTKTSALLWESTPWVELRWNWGVGLLSRMQWQ